MLLFRVLTPALRAGVLIPHLPTAYAVGYGLTRAPRAGSSPGTDEGPQASHVVPCEQSRLNALPSSPLQ